jgi:ornithine cyclodeaminase/alanine dehydrogenase-like protein (mu-crystallin family)
MLVQCAGIRSVRAYDRLPAALERFARDAVAAHGVPVLPMVDAAAAVRERDIIVTATEISKQPRRVIPPERFRAGAFCVPVDFDAMFTPDAVRSMDLFYTDDVAQMDCSRSNGCFRATPPV